MDLITRHSFEVDEVNLRANLDAYATKVISGLSSHFWELPLGDHFVRSPDFKKAYDELLQASEGFQKLTFESAMKALRKNGLVLVVLRTMVGVSPPELADLARTRTQTRVDQGFARSIDQRARDGDLILDDTGAETISRVEALVKAAVASLEEGPRERTAITIHRLDKIDTVEGLKSIHNAATNGVGYVELLYERLLGRPFASHRDSVSEIVGDIVEDKVTLQLVEARIPFYKSRRGEKVAGFDQSPDYFIPDQVKPAVIIEAKLTQDDGTARDKVTRVQHLERLSDDHRKFEVIACIDGRGFQIRLEDMRKLLISTKGKVFSLATMQLLIEHSRLKQFRGAAK